VSINTKGLSLIGFACQPVDKFYDLFTVADTDHGRLFDGPLLMCIADFFVTLAGPLAVGLFFRPDQPGIGAKVLGRFKAADIVDFIDDDQGQGLANTWKASGSVLMFL
jgi:hypothetical protein